MDLRKRLICVEGFDEVGKDTLLNRVRVDWNRKVILYEQPQVEDTGVDYRDSAKFSEYLKKHFSRVVKELDELLSKPRCVMMTRFLVSDNTYSEMFGRERLLEKFVRAQNLLKPDVELKTFLILWKSYGEYLKRVAATHQRIEYTEEEFTRVQDLMAREAQKLDGHIMLVAHETTKDEVFLELGAYLGEKVEIKKSRKWGG